jgi:hypothetical protein
VTKKRIVIANGELSPDAGEAIRSAVLKHMHERDVSAWNLAMMSGIPYDTVRRFVAGTHDTSTTKASLMLAALTNKQPAWLIRSKKNPTSETTN